ncbi:Flavinator of succinate dehydrogenase [Actinobacillus pleuropneumoniae]|nr:Flavinator of succinate dehydrogenase [Actinobacillus pleuropneumoniae]
MAELNRFRIEWECRRGMRELDKMIMPFYKAHFDE